jgi:hypothetical protein
MELSCEHCNHTGKPTEKGKEIVCGSCKAPFPYFTVSKYFNNKNKERVETERAKADTQLKRSLRIGAKK